MCTFKIGQSVIIHSNSHPDSFLYGQLGTITEIESETPYPYTVEFNSDGNIDHSYFSEDELVLAK